MFGAEESQIPGALVCILLDAYAGDIVVRQVKNHNMTFGVHNPVFNKIQIKQFVVRFRVGKILSIDRINAQHNWRTHKPRLWIITTIVNED